MKGLCGILCSGLVCTRPRGEVIDKKIENSEVFVFIMKVTLWYPFHAS